MLEKNTTVTDCNELIFTHLWVDTYLLVLTTYKTYTNNILFKNWQIHNGRRLSIQFVLLQNEKIYKKNFFSNYYLKKNQVCGLRIVHLK